MILTSGLALGTLTMAYAYPGSGPHQGDPSAPELDPASLGGGIAMLAGAVLLMNERRGKNK
jgi:hypothetical protein